MNPILSKVKAISLVEMLIVLILTGLIMVGIYSAWRIMQGYQVRQVQYLSEYLEFIHYIQTLQTDNANSDYIEMESATSFRFYTSSTNYTNYSFQDTICIRSDALNIDTFFIKTESIEYRTITSESLLNKAIINQIQLSLLNSNSNRIRFVFKKDYDASTLLKLEIKNEKTYEWNQD